MCFGVSCLDCAPFFAQRWWSQGQQALHKLRQLLVHHLLIHLLVLVTTNSREVFTAQPEVQVIDSQTDGIDSEVGQQQQKRESLNILFGMSLEGLK